MNHQKVVLAKEMARIEKVAISEGESSESFMLHAGIGIAKKIMELSQSKNVLLLAGKGNNTGDAFVCCHHLLKRGYSIRSLLMFDPSSFSKLCSKYYQEYKKEGGDSESIDLEKDIAIDDDTIIIDAIFGTGFQGKIDLSLSKVITKINALNNLKISIDIPSGVNGDSGVVIDAAICADHTIYLSLPKSGFFLNQGWEHVGILHRVDFGLPKKYIDIATPQFFLIDEDNVSKILPYEKRTRDKYEAGFVVAIAGSVGMEGAANLSGKAALRSGAGIVKVFIFGYDPQKSGDMTDELVKIELDLSNKEEILSICNKASSLLIGPGIGRTNEISLFLKYILPKIKRPVVLDADGLYFYANNLKTTLPNHIIMTPHRKEMERLLHKNNLSSNDIIDETQMFCEEHNSVIVLKGAPTFIFMPGEKPVVVTAGDLGMATAGSGDVLTGVIAALLAQGVDIYEAALLGTHIHGMAGMAAAFDKTSYSMIASDIIEHLPYVFKNIIIHRSQEC